jgi:hypothetical protein
MAGGGRVRTEPVHVARSRRGGCCPREVARGQPGGDGKDQPTTVAATQTPLCRRLNGGGDGLCCRTAVLGRADGGGDTMRCRTAVLVRTDGGGDTMRCRTAVLVRADGDGDGMRCRTAVLVRADENRDGLRCRVGARDTVAFGRARRLRSAATRMLAGSCPAASGVRTPRGSGRRGITRGGRHTRRVLPVHQAAPQTGCREGKTAKTAPTRELPRQGSGTCSGGRTGKDNRR